MGEDIQSVKVRLVGIEGYDVVDKTTALSLANEQELDLVEVGKDGDMSVCKIIDYSKYIYDLEKKNKQQNKNRVELKEIRLRPNIADNDLKIKAKSASRIIEDGDRVKVSVIYKGRENRYISGGIQKLNIFNSMVDFSHTIETVPKVDANRVYMIISPK